MSNLNVQISSDGTITGVTVVAFGDQIIVRDQEQFQLVATNLNRSMVSEIRNVTASKINVKKVKDYYMFELQIYNVERPQTDPGYANVQSNIYTYYYWKLKEEYRWTRYAQFYSNTLLEDLGDLCVALQLMQPCSYVTGKNEYFNDHIHNRFQTIPDSENIAERDPRDISKRVENLDDLVALNELVNFMSASNARRPNWANPGEDNTMWRRFTSIIFNEELNLMEAGHGPLVTQYITRDILRDNLIQMSTGNFSINVYDTLSQVTRVDEHGCRAQDWDTKIPIMMNIRRILELLDACQVFLVSVIGDTADARIADMTVIACDEPERVIQLAYITLSRTTRVSYGSLAVIPQINRTSLAFISKVLAWSFYHPECNTIEILGMEAGNVQDAIMGMMVSMCMPACSMTQVNRRRFMNGIIKILYNQGIIPAGAIPDPNQERNLNTDLIIDLVLVGNLPVQLFALLQAWNGGRGMGNLVDWMMFSDGADPANPPLAPTIWANAQNTVAPFLIGNVQQVQGKMDEIRAMLALWRPLITANPQILNATDINSYVMLLNNYINGFVNAFRDAASNIRLPSALGVLSGVGVTGVVVAPNVRGIQISAFNGLMIGNTSDRMPMQPASTETTAPYDSLIYLFRTVRRVLQMNNRYNNWSEAIDTVLKNLDGRMVLDTSLIFMLKSPADRAAIAAVEANYQLPQYFVDFDARVQAAVNTVARLKELWGFDTHFYISFMHCQTNMAYQNCDITNGLVPRMVNVIATIDLATLRAWKQTVHINPSAGGRYRQHQQTELDYQLTQLRNMGVPSMNSIISGQNLVPVIQVNLRRLIVESNIDKVSTLSVMRVSKKFNADELIDKVYVQGEYLKIYESSAILDAAFEVDPSILDNNNFSNDGPLMTPILDQTRVMPTSITQLQNSTQNYVVRKREYEAYDDYTIKYTMPPSGTIL